LNGANSNVTRPEVNETIMKKSDMDSVTVSQMNLNEHTTNQRPILENLNRAPTAAIS